ncbi:MAG: YtxH domain-containing protein [Parcubacteria group bacterium]
MNNKCNGAGSFLGGVILGALVGVGVALLYAPQSGEETRRQLKVKADEAKKKGLALKKEALAKIDEVKDETAEKVNEFKEKAQRAAKELKSDRKA